MDEIKVEKIKNRDYFSREDNFEKYKHVKSRLIYGKLKNEVPFVTIIVPTFKREKLLKEAIKSILNQEDYDDYEILIVDNEPVFDRETETEKVVRSFNSDKILYYRNEENIGMYGNWNRCIELARSNWLCMVHDDDALVKNHLSTMTNIIKNNSNISFLSCRYTKIDEREIVCEDINNYSQRVTINEKYLTRRTYKDYNFGFVTVFLGGLFSREKAMEIGGFYISTSYCEDYYFVAKFAYYYDIYVIESKLYLYRLAQNQSLKSDIWEDEMVYEYYLYKFISEKRNILLKPFFRFLSKCCIIRRINRFINGTNTIKLGCNLNKDKIYKFCEISEKNTGRLQEVLSEFIRILDKMIRRIYNMLNKNIRLELSTNE